MSAYRNKTLQLMYHVSIFSFLFLFINSVHVKLSIRFPRIFFPYLFSMEKSRPYNSKYTDYILQVFRDRGSFPSRLHDDRASMGLRRDHCRRSDRGDENRHRESILQQTPCHVRYIQVIRVRGLQ